MYYYGLIGWAQAVMLPGLVAVFALNRLVLIDKLLLAPSLSLVFNYFIVLALSAMRLYCRESIVIIVCVELLALVVLVYRADASVTGLWSASRSGWSNNVYFDGGLTPFVYALIFVCFLLVDHEVLNQIYTSFYAWDAVVSWNKWAVFWFHGQVPHGEWNNPAGTQTYPQAIPVIYSLPYVLMSDENIQYFSKMTVIAVPWLILVTALRMSFLVRENYRNVVLLSIPISFYLVSCDAHVGISALFNGYVEAYMAYFGYLSLYIFLIYKTYSEGEGVVCGRNDLIYLAVVVVSTSALVKQTGLLLALAAPLFWWNFCSKKDRGDKRIILTLYGIVLVIGGHWYVYKLIHMLLGLDEAHIASYNEAINLPLVKRPLAALKMFFDVNGYLWIIPLVVGLRARLSRVMMLYSVMPTLLVWIFFVSYDLRALYLVLPWLAMFVAYGIIRWWQFGVQSILHKLLLMSWFVCLAYHVFEKQYMLVSPANPLITYNDLLAHLLAIPPIWLLIQMVQMVLARRVVSGGTIFLSSLATLVVIFILLTPSKYKRTPDLIDSAYSDQLNAVAPRVNNILYSLFKNDGGHGYLFTPYLPVGYIYGLGERFIRSKCGGDAWVETSAVARYYLHAPWCSEGDKDRFEARWMNRFVVKASMDGYVLYELI